jgi:hypothetical protein
VPVAVPVAVPPSPPPYAPTVDGMWEFLAKESGQSDAATLKHMLMSVVSGWRWRCWRQMVAVLAADGGGAGVCTVVV